MIAVDCSQCTDICCKRTTYKLTNADIAVLRDNIDTLYTLHIGTIHNPDGTIQLTAPCINLSEKGECMIYQFRPLGCRIYPVVYNNGPGTDPSCPQHTQITLTQLQRHTIILHHYMHAIEREAKQRLEQ